MLEAPVEQQEGEDEQAVEATVRDKLLHGLYRAQLALKRFLDGRCHSHSLQ